MKIIDNRGFSFIGILVVAVLIIGGVLFFGYNWFNKAGKPETMTDYSNSTKNTVYGQSMDAAKAVECQSNLGQIRSSINMSAQGEGQFPATLQDIHFPQEMYSCPMSKQAYLYDPTTGRVQCPSHPEF
ncbi:MAG: hypothetical protein KBT47_08885, partial [Armatimonadetes bacterium]|nr:hypothetical protein [Candidatus Hippobium faecium]